MLRVEASNLPPPRGAPRPRRLLPEPPVTAQRQPAQPRDEIVPPRYTSGPPATERSLPRPDRDRSAQRWSVRLELGDEDIAKLYGQGLTRGAVVWKKGMLEWRPLLITPELSGLLRRTRTALTEPPATQTPAATATATADRLPRAARLPSGFPATLAGRAVTPNTVAPIAADVVPGSKPRRPLELVAVAAVAFAFAWLGRGNLHPQSNDTAAPLRVSPAPAQTTICEPAPTPATPAAPSSTIPTVSVTDLPLASAGTSTAGAATRGPHEARSGRSSSTSGGGPSRSELVSALSRVAQAAGSCGERGGPVRVVVSFAASGVARSIQVSGQELPAATRSCIIGAASRARVPAFSGDPVTVSKTL